MDQQAFSELFTRDQEVTRPPIVDLLPAASVVQVQSPQLWEAQACTFGVSNTNQSTEYKTLGGISPASILHEQHECRLDNGLEAQRLRCHNLPPAIHR